MFVLRAYIGSHEKAIKRQSAPVGVGRWELPAGVFVSARAYYVEGGVELVNTGGEMCASCDIRPAVGRSVSALPICQRCAAWAESEAAGLAAEIEAGKARLAAQAEATRERMRLVYARVDGVDPTVTPVVSARAPRRTPESLVRHNARKSTDARDARQRVVLAILRDAARPMTVLDIRDRARISEHTVRFALRELVTEKRVTVDSVKVPGAPKPRRERLVFSLPRACRVRDVGCRS